FPPTQMNLSVFCLFLTVTAVARRATLFPYTTLFRSDQGHRRHQVENPSEVEGGGRTQREQPSDDARSCLRQVRQRCVERWEVERSEEHTSELQSRFDLVCRLLLEKKNAEMLVDVVVG